MDMMSTLLYGLMSIMGIGSLVCLIMVVVQMFQHGKTGLGVVTIVLSFCGPGPLIAFIYGWMKAGEWRIKNLMVAWSAMVVVSIVLYGIFAATVMPKLKEQIDAAQKQQMEQLQKQMQAVPSPVPPITLPAPVPAPAP